MPRTLTTSRGRFSLAMMSRTLSGRAKSQRETPGGEAEIKDQPVTSRALGKAYEKESSEHKSSSLDSDKDLNMARSNQVKWHFPANLSSDK